MNKFRLSKEYTDVVLLVSTQAFNCHKVVLAAGSNFFKAMFSSNMMESKMTEVLISDIEPDIFVLILDFVYTSEIVITKSNVQALLAASSFLEILNVFNACCRFLEESIDFNNCLKIHCFAELHFCTNLIKSSKLVILQNFLHIANGEDFLSIKEDKLIEFLCSDDLNVSNEDELIPCILKWLNYDKEKRIKTFDKVLEQIRMVHIDPFYLHDSLESLTDLHKNSKCLSLINEAKNHFLLDGRTNSSANLNVSVRKCFDTLNLILCVGGEDDKVVLRGLESFDPNTLHWKTLSCVPFAVCKHGVVLYDNKFLYLGGGELHDGCSTNFFLRYEMMTDVWCDMPHLLHYRSDHGLLRCDSLIYAIGGESACEAISHVERFDTKTYAWKKVSSLPYPLSRMACASCNGLIYLFGGKIEFTSPPLSKSSDGKEESVVMREASMSIMSYDPKIDSWTVLSCALEYSRIGAVAIAYKTNIFIIGGASVVIERFDTKTHALSTCASMSYKRDRPGVSLCHDKIFIFGGEGEQGYVEEIEVYDIKENSFQIIGKLPAARSGMACVSVFIHKDIYGKTNYICEDTLLGV